MIGRTVRTFIRWLGVSMKPPGPMSEPSSCSSSPESTASAVVSITWLRLMLRCCIASGLTCTCSICSRSPHRVTLATPGTWSRRARTVQYAVMDIWIKDWSSDVIPILTARLVAEAGASITGGAAHVGRVALTAVIRSCTSCRASIRSTPRSKISWTLDSCGEDFDRRMSSPSTPFSACSSGTVTSSSTSAVERPRHTVWTMTRGGANSGKTSSRDDGSTTIPIAMTSAPSAATRCRKRRLVAIVQPMRVPRWPAITRHR
jgi:hypothetical protein